ncbi:MAG: penicillin-binding protein [Bacteroidetes bacterium]|nr:penicillin-binding protein [Bacteroidota bacterium]
MIFFPRKYKKSIITFWILFSLLILSLPIYIYSVNANLFGLFGGLPSSNILENPENELSSELYSADGILLGKYYRLNRSSVKYHEISPNLINSLISTEDCRFKKHSGIDLKGLLRAFFLSIVLRRKKGGGSTITQQLAKNLFNTRGDRYKGYLSKIPIIRTIVIKSKEWIVATKLERAYTKEEILSMYLNTVSFGSNTFGIKSAAKTFFDVEPIDLTIDQSALLIGLLKAPTKYSPIINPKNSIQRRNVILFQLLKSKYITREQFEKYNKLPLNLKYKIQDHKSGIATYFRAIVGRYLLNWSKNNGYDLYSDGLKIYTTIDSKLQKHAEEAVKEHMSELQEKFFEHWGQENPWRHEGGKEIENFIEEYAKKTELYKKLKKEYGDDDTIFKILNTPRKIKIFTWNGDVEVNMSPLEEIAYNKKLLRAGLMSIDPSTGDIKAWVGDINFNFFKYDHVFQGDRQPGSLFKAFVYTVAIDNGFSPDDKINDVPITFSIPGGTWTPQNWNKIYTGQKLTLRQAMCRSINSVTAYLIKKFGPKLIIEYAKKMGITSYLDPVPALCLGTSSLTLYELLGAYNVFANKGVWTKPLFITRIEDKYGNIIKQFTHKKREAISEKTAYLMTYMLRGAQQEIGGSAHNLPEIITEDNEIASKSGTTQNHSDGWFIGLTSSLSTGVWVGGEDRCIHFKDFTNGQSGKTAKPLWVKYMVRVYNDPELNYKKGKFSKPSKRLQKHKNIKKFFKDEDSNDIVEENILEEEDSNDLDLEQIY